MLKDCGGILTMESACMLNSLIGGTGETDVMGRERIVHCGPVHTQFVHCKGPRGVERPSAFGRFIWEQAGEGSRKDFPCKRALSSACFFFLLSSFFFPFHAPFNFTGVPLHRITHLAAAHTVVTSSRILTTPFRRGETAVD
jgi:hypothetical protein